MILRHPLGQGRLVDGCGRRRGRLLLGGVNFDAHENCSRDGQQDAECNPDFLGDENDQDHNPDHGPQPPVFRALCHDFPRQVPGAARQLGCVTGKCEHNALGIGGWVPRHIMRRLCKADSGRRGIGAGSGAPCGASGRRRVHGRGGCDLNGAQHAHAQTRDRCGGGALAREEPDVSGLGATNRHTRYRKGEFDAWRAGLVGFATALHDFDQLAMEAPWVQEARRVVGHLLGMPSVEAILEALANGEVAFLRLDEALGERWASPEPRDPYAAQFRQVLANALAGIEAARCHPRHRTRCLPWWKVPRPRSKPPSRRRIR